jgi:hypothetical protein
VNVAVTPAGRPLTESATVPVKPADGVTVIVVVTPFVLLRLTLTELGDADSEKSA